MYHPNRRDARPAALAVAALVLCGLFAFGLGQALGHRAATVRGSAVSGEVRLPAAGSSLQAAPDTVAAAQSAPPVASAAPLSLPAQHNDSSADHDHGQSGDGDPGGHGHGGDGSDGGGGGGDKAGGSDQGGN